MHGVASCWHPCRAGSSGLELSWKWDYETKSPSCARGRDVLAQLDPHVWKSYYNYYSDGKSLDEITRETLNDARGHGVTSRADRFSEPFPVLKMTIFKTSTICRQPTFWAGCWRSSRVCESRQPKPSPTLTLLTLVSAPTISPPVPRQTQLGKLSTSYRQHLLILINCQKITLITGQVQT